MIGENRETQQVNSKTAGKMLEEVFDPSFAMVVVLPCQRIGAE
jgi:hypothetical protein